MWAETQSYCKRKVQRLGPFPHFFLHRIHVFNYQHHNFTMFQAIFAFKFTSGFLYVGNLLRGLARGVLALRNIHDITSHLIPTLSSPPIAHLLDAPIPPLDLLEEFRTQSSSGGLIVIEVPPLVLPSPIPTHSYQSSLATVTPNRLLDLVHLLLLLAFIFGLVLLLPGLAYVCATIADRISAFSRFSRKNFKAYGFSLVPIFSLVLLFSLVSNFFSTQIFSLRLLVSPASLLLLWIGPVCGLLSPGRASMLTKYLSLQLHLSSHQFILYPSYPFTRKFRIR